MKRIFAVTAIVCLLSLQALAGDIPTVGAPQPAPQTSSLKTEDALGDIPSDGATSTEFGDIPSVGLSAVLAALSFLM